LANGDQRGQRPAKGGGPSGGAVAPAKMTKGEKMLDDMRKAGRPITPAMEQMAAWLDSMNKDTGDVPMLKPGGCDE